MVPTSAADDYGTNYDAIEVLAWIGARFPEVKLGTSVIVVPQRNAVVLAKELASIDALSGGRLIAGVGAGWNEEEFAKSRDGRPVPRPRRLPRRDHRPVAPPVVGLREPFEGRFHRSDDFVFAPLPAQGADVPIAVGGRAEAALIRAGTRGDWYHSSATSAAKYAERVPVIRAAAEAAGRPMPRLTARAWTEFGEATTNHYAIRGTPDEMAAEIRAFAALGVDHLAVWFDATRPDELVELMERFAREVAPAVED